MQRNRQTLALIAVGIGVVAALATAPLAGADTQLPSCQTTGGSSVSGGQVTDCASPGNVQIDATPDFIPNESYGPFFGFPGFF